MFDFFDNGFGRGVVLEFFGFVFVVDIVINMDEFVVVVGVGEEDDGDVEEFVVGDEFGVGGVGFKGEFVDVYGDGVDEEGVEFLVVGVVLGGVDVGEFLFEVCVLR